MNNHESINQIIFTGAPINLFEMFNLEIPDNEAIEPKNFEKVKIILTFQTVFEKCNGFGKSDFVVDWAKRLLHRATAHCSLEFADWKELIFSK